MFGDKAEGGENIGEIILETLLSFDIDSITDLNFGYN